ncbi:hypothetical protein ACWYRQ_06285 [Clostridioides difficile]
MNAYENVVIYKCCKEKKYQNKYGTIVAYIFIKKGVIKHGVER